MVATVLPATARRWPRLSGRTPTGQSFVVSVNHLKSKGSACDGEDEPFVPGSQGYCNNVRTMRCSDLAAWLSGDPTGTGDPDVLILGDLNSYAKEDPIAAIKADEFNNLIETFLGSDAYSYVFDGQWGYLDHALGSASIVSQVTGVGDYHINADEPSVLDYNTEFKSDRPGYHPIRTRRVPHLRPRSGDRRPGLAQLSAGTG